MPCTVVVGAQWGDEGKGKIIDLLTSEAEVVVRFQGGSNAGHTVVVGGEQYVLHLVPSGVLREKVVCVIGNGVVVDPVGLASEIKSLESKGFKLAGRLFISDLAHVTLPYHRRMDEAREAKRGAVKIGTTHRGIGPTYADKFGRVGIKMGDLLDQETFLRKVRHNLEEKNILFRDYFGVAEISEQEVITQYREYLPVLRDMIKDTVVMLRDMVSAGKRIMLEGAQGTLLDVDFGTYPFVTASNPTSGGACTGSGIPPTAINRVVGVAKAYTTRVGLGPMPTEMPPDEDESMRIRGREYGATTGRPRRCGWFDAVAVRRAVAVNGLTEIAITKLDVLDCLEKIPVCTAYSYRGEMLTDFPNRNEIVEECKPVFKEMPGWKTETAGARKIGDLPKEAREYVEFIQQSVGAPISIVSVGAGREQTILAR